MHGDQTDQYFSHGLWSGIIFKRENASSNSKNIFFYIRITIRSRVGTQREYHVHNLGVTDSFSGIIKIHQN